MTTALHWIGLVLGLLVVAFAILGFWHGLAAAERAGQPCAGTAVVVVAALRNPQSVFNLMVYTHASRAMLA